MKRPLADIVTHWALFESEITTLTELLLAGTKNRPIGWRTSEFMRRARLCRSQIHAAFPSQEIRECFERQIYSPMGRPKEVRDWINHCLIWGGMNASEPVVEFITTRARKRTKTAFSALDLNQIVSRIAQLAGSVGSFARVDDHLPLSSQCKSELLRVLGPNRWKRATNEALGLPP